MRRHARLFPLAGSSNVSIDFKPFIWTAYTDTILVKVRWVQSVTHKLTAH